MSAAFELIAKRAIVVNLAVEDGDDGPIFVGDGLLAAVQVTDMPTAVSAWAAQENLFHPRREFRDVGAADMAIASLADYLANISDIGRHDWEVASHRLLDDVRGTLLIRRKSQHVASAQ